MEAAYRGLLYIANVKRAHLMPCKNEDLKKLLCRLTVLAMPFLIVVAVELFVLPLNYFTFRAWEALWVKEPNQWLPGPFYPEQTLSLIEEGDLAPRTSKSVLKKVTWETDKYGYRNSPFDSMSKLKVMLIGDSLTAGSSLDQSDIVQEVLSREKNIPTYGYAPATISAYYSDPRFMNVRPPFIVVSSVERNIVSNLSPVIISQGLSKNIATPLQASLLIYHDRFVKQSVLNYFRARLGDGNWSFLRKDQGDSDKNQKPMIFHRGKQAIISVSPTDVEKVISVLENYQRTARKYGQEFIFFPVPNKETLYYADAPETERAAFLSDVIGLAKKRNIPVVDTLAVFMAAIKREPDKLLYNLDDTHWNSRGARLAADELARIIKAIETPNNKLKQKGKRLVLSHDGKSEPA